MIVRANGNTYSAHAASTYILEMFLHISRTFFRVEYGVARLTAHVFLPDYCPRGASLDAFVTLPATANNRRVGHAERIIGKYRGKSYLATPPRRYKQSALAYPTATRQYRRRLMRKRTRVSVAIRRLRSGYHIRGISQPLNIGLAIERQLVEASVDRAVVMKILVSRLVVYALQYVIVEFVAYRDSIGKALGLLDAAHVAESNEARALVV